MPTSSFTKEFVLNNKKSVDSFLEIISNPPQTHKINKTLLNPEKEKQSEIRLKQMLSKR